MKNWQKLMSGLGGAIALLCLTTSTAMAADSKWDTAGFVENATYNRESRGISKFRNTAQFEFSKNFGSKFGTSKFQVNGTLRGTYDGVYELNDDEWGDNAGGAIMLENGSALGPGGPGTGPALVEHGGGFGFGDPFMPPTTGFFPNYPVIPGAPFNGGHFNQQLGLTNVLGLSNPNDGLEALGAHRGGTSGGVQFGVPVRPCDEDPRGCTALRGYMDADADELAWSDFNDRLDFIRELYIQANFDLDSGNQLGVKVGKQQIVWGRTDLFRVLDVLNPVDYSRNNIYDELEDIRIPMWMAELEYRWGSVGIFDDLNASVVWNFDKFRPNNLGQSGTPNQILDVGSFFRGMANCWENGCTVSNFPLPDHNGVGVAGFGAVDFGPGVLGIRDVDMPSWSLSNTQVGIKLEGVLGDFGFSLNALEYRSQLPSLRGNVISADPFAPGATDNYDYALAFDVAFPRITLIGGSVDYYMDSMKSTWRGEIAWTDGEEFADTSVPELFSESDVLRWVIGIDRPTFIPFLNKNRAFLISAQVFGQHILDHNETTGVVNPLLPPPGKIGMPDHEDNYTFTLLVQGWYWNDRLNPQIIVAHDVEAGHTTVAPSIEYLLDDHWQFTLRANYKLDDGVESWDDNRTGIPYPGLSCALSGVDGDPTTCDGPIGPNAAGTVSNGSLSGASPLGRFRDGPLGMANQEDEIQFTIRYRY